MSTVEPSLHRRYQQIAPACVRDHKLERVGGVPNEIWDACEEVLGYAPKTRSQKRLWGKIVESLRYADATPDRIYAVALWYRKHWPNVDLTLNAIEKWYSHFLAMEEARNATRARVCPECETGGGLHVAGCSKANGSYLH